MKALFICDVTKSGGAGHLIRSISIAEQAQIRGLEILFCGQFETPFAQSVLAATGFRSIDFPGNSEALADLAVANGIKIVHCDDYKRRPELHSALSQRGIVLSTIEDSSYGSRAADLIIDPSPNAELTYRQGASSTTHLRGLTYVPLRKSISISAQARRAKNAKLGSVNGEQFSVLIVLGGTDAAGATTKMVDLWTKSVPHTICFAVLPDQKLANIEHRGTSEIHWLPPSREVADLFSRVDAVITAAGTTVWEVSAVGVAAAVIQQAENQSANYKYAVDNCAMLGLGTVDDLSKSESRVQAIMRQVPLIGFPSAPSVDAAGAERIVSEWIECSSESHALRMREARISDASNLYDWRNDADVRAVSRDSQPLEWADHVNWLRSVISAPDRKLLVAALGWKPVGTARFDQMNGTPTEWEISLTVSPDNRGQGLGNVLLDKSEAWLRSQYHGVIDVIAYVKVDNEISSGLFARNGYRKQAVDGSSQMILWRKRLELPH